MTRVVIVIERVHVYKTESRRSDDLNKVRTIASIQRTNIDLIDNGRNPSLSSLIILSYLYRRSLEKIGASSDEHSLISVCSIPDYLRLWGDQCNDDHSYPSFVFLLTFVRKRYALTFFRIFFITLGKDWQ